MNAITKELVFEAADQIVAEGKKATVASVRNVLGKGSFSTINVFMQEWRNQQLDVVEAPSSEIPKPILELAEKLWKEAQHLAGEELKAQREGLEVWKENLEEEKREAISFADNLIQEVEFFKGHYQSEKNNVEALKVKMHSLENQLVQCRVNYENAMERLKDIKKNASRYEELYSELGLEKKGLLEQLSEQATQIVRLESVVEQTKAVMKHQIDTLNDKQKETAVALEESRNALVQEQAAAAELKLEIARKEGIIQQLEKKRVGIAVTRSKTNKQTQENN